MFASPLHLVCHRNTEYSALYCGLASQGHDDTMTRLALFPGPRLGSEVLANPPGSWPGSLVRVKTPPRSVPQDLRLWMAIGPQRDRAGPGSFKSFRRAT